MHISVSSGFGEISFRSFKALQSGHTEFLRSVYPASINTAAIAELASEADLTPLHLASFSGSDDAVRDHPHIMPSTLIPGGKGNLYTNILVFWKKSCLLQRSVSNERSNEFTFCRGIHEI